MNWSQRVIKVIYFNDTVSNSEKNAEINDQADNQSTHTVAEYMS